MQKDKDIGKGNLSLLVIPKKYEPIIFNTYHDSLLAGHQGPYHTAMTIRQKIFIHNLMNKVKRYIEARVQLIGRLLLEWRIKQALEYKNRAKRYKNEEIFKDNQMV